VNLFDDLRMRESAAPYERLARKALASYGLDQANLVAISVSDRIVFRVTDTDLCYALTIHPREWDRRGCERSLLWQMALCREMRLRCPEPILNLGGDLVQNLSTQGISGFRLVTLTSWIEGEAIEPGEWTPRHAEEVGSFVGRLHGHGGSHAVPPELATDILSTDRLRERIDPPSLANTHADLEEPLLMEALTKACDVLSSGVGCTGAIGIIHGNLIPEHALFRETSPGLVGFHRTALGYAAYDLAALTQRFGGLEQKAELRDALLDGYASNAPLPVPADGLQGFGVCRLLEEIDALPLDAPSRQVSRLASSLRETLENE